MTRWLPKLLTLLMACALAGAGAYWFMRIAGGPPAPDPRSLNRAVDAPVSTFREPLSLFGNAQTQALTNVKLIGVIAGQDGAGRAILTVNDGPPKSYASGGLISPGTTLKLVESRGVVVDSNGVESRIALPPRATVAANALVSVAMPGRPASGAQAVPQPPPAQIPMAPAPAGGQATASGAIGSGISPGQQAPQPGQPKLRE